MNTGSDSTSDSEEPRKMGFDIHYSHTASHSNCISDDEIKLLSTASLEDTTQEGPENGENNDNKPKIADWRYGPAQIWYDMLEVPDSGEGFNYGFKTNQVYLSQRGNLTDAIIEKADENIATELIADDAFLMVSQLHWEDEVVWDGNDIKAKVLQKLNSKTNAAGWLPSSGSRTAGAFSQPGRNIPVTGNSNSKMTAGGNATSSNKQKNQM